MPQRVKGSGENLEWTERARQVVARSVVGDVFGHPLSVSTVMCPNSNLMVVYSVKLHSAVKNRGD